jgi:hypothetical protein
MPDSPGGAGKTFGNAKKQYQSSSATATESLDQVNNSDILQAVVVCNCPQDL